MSDQKNTTNSTNIDDYLLSINIDDSPASDTTSAQALDMDFLNQLGGDNSTNTQADPFEGLNLDSLQTPAQSTAPSQTDEFDFLTAQAPQDTHSTISPELAVGAGAVVAGAGMIAQNAINNAEDATKKGKGFFSGRFGKKPTPAPSADTGAQDSLTETLLANKNAKKGLFSRQTTKDKPAKETTSGIVPPKKEKKPLFSLGKKDKNTTSTDTPIPPKASKAPKAKSAQTPDAKKKNQLLLGALACLALLAVVAYLFLNNSNSISTPAPVPVANNAPPPAPAETAPPATAPTTAQGETILPSTTPNVNPDEILNAQIPEDPALVKEEIDRLKDTGARLDEQGKIIKEQLTIMEDLTTAKAEQIALLEKQIAELEKQKSTVATPAQAQAPAPAPAEATPPPAPAQ